jgi:hypothetical protein
MTTLGTLSDWQVADLIGYLTTGQFWASLHTADPRVGVPTANEFGGTSYHRIEVTMAASGSRLLVSTNAQDWSTLAAGTLSHVGLFDGSIGGHLRAAMPLDVPLVIVEGAAYGLAPGAIYLSF